ncbi:hypothetical protein NMG60_11001803 [Bertholletia excelsa]
MASAERELEDQLVEVGNRLLQPPSSVDELLPLLDQVENFLSRVEQSPSKSMQDALSPSMNALVTDELLKHTDEDVKVAVASCISEITRITAPDAPYDDDKMKEVFQLIVSSFENLSDKASRSYNKRTMILETVAKVRSCVVMLDLECDALIVEMFQHFLKAIRDYHPENVLSSMETIMTLVLEESEDISIELISPILASVKVDNKEVLPIARKLGERVFENCAAKLKPYLIQAKKSLDFSLDDYSKVITAICDGKTGAVAPSDPNACGDQIAEEDKLARASSEEIAQADENKLAGTSPSEVAQDKESKESGTDTHTGGEDPAVGKSPKSAMSNGVAETGNEDKLADPESSTKVEHVQGDQSVDNNVTSNAEPDDSNNGKIEKLESTSEQITKKRGRKPTSLANSAEPSDSSHADSNKEAERMADIRKSGKEVRSTPSEEPSVEAAITSEKEKETNQISSPKLLESEPVNATPPSPSGSAPDEGRSKKAGRPKKKENLMQDVPPSAKVSKKASEGTSDLDVKMQRRSGKKAAAESSIEEKATPLDVSKSEGGTTSDSEAKPLKQSGRKVDLKDKIVDGSSKKREDGKKRGRGKSTSEKDVMKASAKDDDELEMVSSPKRASKSAKDEGHSEESAKGGSKRKHTAEKASASVEYDESLVGLKVKVWWPQDKMYYEGVIDSYDSAKKKHKVLYNDGDEEVLNLRRQKFEFIKDDSMSDRVEPTESKTPDPSPEMHKKKKAKTNSEPSAKQGKSEGSRGETSSSKLAAALKSGRKSREDSKLKTKDDNASKAGGRSDDDAGGKSKDRLQKTSNKSSGDASRTSGKSKDVDSDPPKSSTKVKQDTPKSSSKESPKTTSKDTPKAAIKSKGKGIKSGNKSSFNGSGKTKSGSVKGKDSEGKEKSNDTAKALESVKGKSSETLKGQEADAKGGKKGQEADAKGGKKGQEAEMKSGTKSGKKRRRGVKS